MAIEAVSFRPISSNGKLAPIKVVKYGRRGYPRIVIHPTLRASSTYVSIDATCPDSCKFKLAGCYVRAGNVKKIALAMDKAAKGLSGVEVMALEAKAILHALFTNRAGVLVQKKHVYPLRLHVGGDVPNTEGTRILAAAVERWPHPVWTYTARWATVLRAAWGRISVLGSVQTAQEAEKALGRGYVPALTVRSFPASGKPFTVEGSSVKFIPCPAETQDRTCVTCKLCWNADRLKLLGYGIAFQLHGVDAGKARRKLPVLRTSEDTQELLAL